MSCRACFTGPLKYIDLTCASKQDWLKGPVYMSAHMMLFNHFNRRKYFAFGTWSWVNVRWNTPFHLLLELKHNWLPLHSNSIHFFSMGKHTFLCMHTLRIHWETLLWNGSHLITFRVLHVDCKALKLVENCKGVFVPDKHTSPITWFSVQSSVCVYVHSYRHLLVNCRSALWDLACMASLLFQHVCASEFHVWVVCVGVLLHEGCVVWGGRERDLVYDSV